MLSSTNEPGNGRMVLGKYFDVRNVVINQLGQVIIIWGARERAIWRGEEER